MCVSMCACLSTYIKAVTVIYLLSEPGGGGDLIIGTSSISLHLEIAFDFLLIAFFFLFSLNKHQQKILKHKIKQNKIKENYNYLTKHRNTNIEWVLSRSWGKQWCWLKWQIKRLLSLCIINISSSRNKI